MAVVANLDAILSAKVDQFESKIRRAASTTDLLQKEFREAGGTQREWNKLVKEGERVTQSMLTPLERYQKEVRDLDRLLKVGTIDQRTYNRAVAASATNYRSASVAGGLFAGSLRRIGTTILATAAAYASFASLRTLARRFNTDANALDEFAKTADKLSIVPERLKEIEVAAAITAGVTDQVLSKALQRLQTNISEATTGVGEAKDALEELRLDPSQLNLLSTDEQFSRIADAIRDLPNPNDQLRITADLFGQRGAGLVNTLRLGSEEIERQTAFLRENNLELSRADLSAVESANDAYTRLSETAGAFSQRLTSELSPAVEDFYETLTTALQDLSQTGSLEAIGENTATLIGAAAASVELLSDSIQGYTFAYLQLESLITGNSDRLNNFNNGILNRVVREQFGGNQPEIEITPEINTDEIENGINEIDRLKTQFDRLLETPTDIFNKQIEDIEKLREAGALTEQQLETLRNQFQERLDNQLNLNNDTTTDEIANSSNRLTEALDKEAAKIREINELQNNVASSVNVRDSITEGSNEAFDIIFSRGNNDSQTKLLQERNRIAKDELAALRELIASMKEVAESTEETAENVSATATGDTIEVSTVTW